MAKIRNVLFAVGDDTMPARVKERLKTRNVDMVSAQKYAKMGVDMYLKSNPDCDTIVIKEYLENRAPYTERELAAFNDERDLNIVVFLSSVHKGQDYMRRLYAAGITSAIFTDNTHSATYEEVARLIENRRSRKDARAYYGISDELYEIELIEPAMLTSIINFFESDKDDLPFEKKYEYVIGLLNHNQNVDLLEHLPQTIRKQCLDSFLSDPFVAGRKRKKANPRRKRYYVEPGSSGGKKSGRRIGKRADAKAIEMKSSSGKEKRGLRFWFSKTSQKTDAVDELLSDAVSSSVETDEGFIASRSAELMKSGMTVTDAYKTALEELEARKNLPDAKLPKDEQEANVKNEEKTDRRIEAKVEDKIEPKLEPKTKRKKPSVVILPQVDEDVPKEPAAEHTKDTGNLARNTRRKRKVLPKGQMDFGELMDSGVENTGSRQETGASKQPVEVSDDAISFDSLISAAYKDDSKSTSKVMPDETKASVDSIVSGKDEDLSEGTDVVVGVQKNEYSKGSKVVQVVDVVPAVDIPLPSLPSVSDNGKKASADAGEGIGNEADKNKAKSVRPVADTLVKEQDSSNDIQKRRKSAQARAGEILNSLGEEQTKKKKRKLRAENTDVQKSKPEPNEKPKKEKQPKVKKVRENKEKPVTTEDGMTPGISVKKLAAVVGSVAGAAAIVAVVVFGGRSAETETSATRQSVSYSVIISGSTTKSEESTQTGATEGTVESTTEGTTTEKKTTQKKTTEKKTTQQPTTQKKTTQKHTTQAPTTQRATTQAPTQRATTQAPTAQRPTTQRPTTQAPTQRPTTQAPTTQRPTTQKQQPATRNPGGSYSGGGAYTGSEVKSYISSHPSAAIQVINSNGGAYWFNHRTNGSGASSSMGNIVSGGTYISSVLYNGAGQACGLSFVQS